MKEIIVYFLASIAGLFVFGFSIHMFIGGLVSPQTEAVAIIIGCLIAATAMGYLAWDVAKKRRRM